MQFDQALNLTERAMKCAGRMVHTETWQGQDISENPHARMVELLNFHIFASMDSEDLAFYREQVEPNLPWADDHFEERVCGHPINPGVEWENWPWAKSAEGSLENSQFNHNYMERYWPRWAGMTGPARDVPEFLGLMDIVDTLDIDSRMGIRGQYGDLADLLRLLDEQPLTRQAYLPIFFPEDTGSANPGRKPCTLGYHFIMRDNRLHCNYYIRSCDMHRHLRDDVYLTVRLVLWILDHLRSTNERWTEVKPGEFNMYITSLHMFLGDFQLKYKHNPGE